jgi:hypothetical protein
VTEDEIDQDLAVAAAADELYGWAVDTLDALDALRASAASEDITLEEWRARDIELRATAPVPAPDADEVRALRLRAVVASIESGDRDDLRRLAARLNALSRPAPSDAELLEELAGLAALARDEPGQHGARLERTCQRLRRWITDSGRRDPVTGLHWDLIGRHRWTEHPLVGPVPVPVNAARRAALSAATPQALDEARLVAPDSDATLRRTELSAQLLVSELTWLADLVAGDLPDNSELRPVADELRALYQQPALRRALLEATAAGWPPPFGMGDVPP